MHVWDFSESDYIQLISSMVRTTPEGKYFGLEIDTMVGDVHTSAVWNKNLMFGNGCWMEFRV